MKKNIETDKICAEKILCYIGDIRECFEHYDIKGYSDLADKRLAQYALTQILTNIHEARKRLTDETLLKMPEFNKIRLATSRNIASHDYDRLDFETVYIICQRRLLSEIVSNELKEVISGDKGKQENNE